MSFWKEPGVIIILGILLFWFVAMAVEAPHILLNLSLVGMAVIVVVALGASCYAVVGRLHGAATGYLRGRIEVAERAVQEALIERDRARSGAKEIYQAVDHQLRVAFRRRNRLVGIALLGGYGPLVFREFYRPKKQLAWY